MQVLRKAILSCLALLSGSPALQAAPSEPTPPPVIVVAADSAYDVAADGTYVQTYHFEFRPTNDAAARREGQQAVTYSPSLERFSLLEAYTRKADGRVIPVAKGSIHDQTKAASADLSSFGDQRQKVIVFPDAAGGDTLVYTWRREVNRPFFPGQFMASVYLSDAMPWERMTMTIRAPHAMALRTEAHGFSEARAEDGGTDVVRFSADQSDAAAQPAAIGPYDRLPRVFVSSFPDYDAFAAAYAGQLAAKTRVTPEIQALADQVVEHAADRREQAKLLYEWVSRKIRYVAVYLGAGALEAHDAATVLARGWGDCKDHTVLFQALLASRGIDADLAMINLGHHYTLSGPPTFAQLNHAISYLPEFDLYADTTAGTARFGILPFEEYGKPTVLAVATGDALRRTPELPEGVATMQLRTVARMGADGSVSGATSTTASGPFAIDLRQRAMWAQANGPAEAAANQLRALGTEGSGAFVFDPPLKLEGGFAMGGSFQLAAQPDIDDGESFLPPVGLRILRRPGDLLLGPMTRSNLADDAPTPCYPGRQVEDIALELPPGRRLARLPRGVSIDNAVLSYESRWSMRDQTLEVHRELVSKVSGPLCAGETRRLAAAALLAIRRDEQRRVSLADQSPD